MHSLTKYVHALTISLLALLVLPVCSLFTLLIVLLRFSTKESRRRLVFQLNVLVICVALTPGILTGLTSGKAILDPFNQVSKSVYITATVFALYPPLLYDSILLARFFALHPMAITPSLTLVKIFAFPFCIKCARVVVLARFFDVTQDHSW
ncbi:hypothetical protein EDC04DRAFT_2232575 [Pisolithus marmoratus]|nr:hypothetical protein EDC04DRAFT_2232575 [Pisolithus marmoratus]